MMYPRQGLVTGQDFIRAVKMRINRFELYRLRKNSPGRGGEAL
jgi:hypothetical protein